MWIVPNLENLNKHGFENTWNDTWRKEVENTWNTPWTKQIQADEVLPENMVVELLVNPLNQEEENQLFLYISIDGNVPETVDLCFALDILGEMISDGTVVYRKEEPPKTEDEVAAIKMKLDMLLAGQYDKASKKVTNKE